MASISNTPKRKLAPQQRCAKKSSFDQQGVPGALFSYKMGEMPNSLSVEDKENSPPVMANESQATILPDFSPLCTQGDAMAAKPLLILNLEDEFGSENNTLPKIGTQPAVSRHQTVGKEDRRTWGSTHNITTLLDWNGDRELATQGAPTLTPEAPPDSKPMPLSLENEYDEAEDEQTTRSSLGRGMFSTLEGSLPRHVRPVERHSLGANSTGSVSPRPGGGGGPLRPLDLLEACGGLESFPGMAHLKRERSAKQPGGASSAHTQSEGAKGGKGPPDPFAVPRPPAASAPAQAAVVASPTEEGAEQETPGTLRGKARARLRTRLSDCGPEEEAGREGGGGGGERPGEDEEPRGLPWPREREATWAGQAPAAPHPVPGRPDPGTVAGKPLAVARATPGWGGTERSPLPRASLAAAFSAVRLVPRSRSASGAAAAAAVRGRAMSVGGVGTDVDCSSSSSAPSSPCGRGGGGVRSRSRSGEPLSHSDVAMKLEALYRTAGMSTSPARRRPSQEEGRGGSSMDSSPGFKLHKGALFGSGSFDGDGEEGEGVGSGANSMQLNSSSSMVADRLGLSPRTSPLKSSPQSFFSSTENSVEASPAAQGHDRKGLTQNTLQSNRTKQNHSAMMSMMNRGTPARRRFAVLSTPRAGGSLSSSDRGSTFGTPATSRRPDPWEAHPYRATPTARSPTHSRHRPPVPLGFPPAPQSAVAAGTGSGSPSLPSSTPSRLNDSGRTDSFRTAGQHSSPGASPLSKNLFGAFEDDDADEAEGGFQDSMMGSPIPFRPSPFADRRRPPMPRPAHEGGGGGGGTAGAQGPGPGGSRPGSPSFRPTPFPALPDSPASTNASGASLSGGSVGAGAGGLLSVAPPRGRVGALLPSDLARRPPSPAPGTHARQTSAPVVPAAAAGAAAGGYLRPRRGPGSSSLDLPPPGRGGRGGGRGGPGAGRRATVGVGVPMPDPAAFAEPASPRAGPCPPTPVRTPAWAVASSARKTPLVRQNSLSKSKILVQDGHLLDDSEVVPFTFEGHFIEVSTLGSGVSADVLRVISKEDTQFYAVKRSKFQFKGKKDRDFVLQEVKCMLKLEESPSPYIMKFYRTWQEDGYCFTQMEYCVGTLQLYLSRLGGARPPAGALWQAAHDLGAGLAAVHAAGLVHLDVKPENTLVSTRGLLKLGDFGSAARAGADGDDGREGDPRYLAPELLGRAAKRPPADLFGLGLVLWECAARPPRAPARGGGGGGGGGGGLPSQGPRWQAFREGRAPRLPEGEGGAPPGLQALVDQLLAVDPAARPTAAAVAAHPQAAQAGMVAAAFAAGGGSSWGEAETEGEDMRPFFAPAAVPNPGEMLQSLAGNINNGIKEDDLLTPEHHTGEFAIRKHPVKTTLFEDSSLSSEDSIS